MEHGATGISVPVYIGRLSGTGWEQREWSEWGWEYQEGDSSKQSPCVQSSPIHIPKAMPEPLKPCQLSPTVSTSFGPSAGLGIKTKAKQKYVQQLKLGLWWNIKMPIYICVCCNFIRNLLGEPEWGLAGPQELAAETFPLETWDTAAPSLLVKISVIMASFAYASSRALLFLFLIFTGTLLGSR